MRRNSCFIISGGVNIYPVEIDQEVLEHPAVYDVAVVGVPNEEWGEEIKAVVQLNEGYAPSEALAKEIVAFAKPGDLSLHHSEYCAYIMTISFGIEKGIVPAAACGPLLAGSELAGGGSLIGIASMAAYRSSAFVPGYGAAKAGIVNLTANLARRWADQGVRVNAIAPGVIETPMTAPLAAYAELGDPERAHIAMGRFGTVDEVVGTALFLASSAASYVTGQTFAVDGGYLTI